MAIPQLLILALSWIAAAAGARETITDADSMPPYHRRIAREETIVDTDGGTTSISVHGSIPKTVLELGPDRDHGGVLATRCTDEAVELFTSTPDWWFAETLALGVGTVIVAPPELGCKPQAGQEEKEWLKEATVPFYRLMSDEPVKRLSVPPPVEAGYNLTANNIKTGAWVRVVSTEVGLFGCFGPSTTLEATYFPPGDPPNNTPSLTDADTDNVSSMHLQSSTTNQSGAVSAEERKRRISYSFDKTAKLTFKYNTDSGRSASTKDKYIYKKKDSSKDCQAGCSSRRSQGLITADAAKACKRTCGGGGSSFETAVKCRNCYGYFEAGIKIKFKIKAWLGGIDTRGYPWYKPHKFRPYGAGARVEHAVFKMFGELRTEATLVAAIQASKRITRSIDFFGKKSLGRVTIWAGLIPIYISSAFSLGASVEINAMLKGEASAGFKFSRRIEAGYQLVNGGWSEIKKSTGNGLEKIGPEFSAEASMSATLRLVPEVALTFYGFASLKVSVQPGLYVDTHAACKYKSGLWSSPSWRGRRSCDGVNWEVGFDVPLHVSLDAADGAVAALKKIGFNPRKLLSLPRKFGPYYLVSKTKLKSGCLKVGYCAKRNPPPPPPRTTRRTTVRTTRRTTAGRTTVGRTTVGRTTVGRTTVGRTTVATTTKATPSPPPPPSVPNACKDPIRAGYNSGCSVDAACKTASDDASNRECTCLDGFEGDGVVCRVKEPCAASSCDVCLTDDRCTWCPNPPRGGKNCASQGTFTSGSACTGGTWDDVCSAPETPISSITIATPASSLVVSGACNSNLNGVYIKQGTTKDGKAYHKGGVGGSYYIYHDRDCSGGSSEPRWIFDTSEPSTTAAEDLDGDGKCSYSGRIYSTSNTPPAGENTWRLSCDSKWQDSRITIATVAGTITAGTSTLIKWSGGPDEAIGVSFFWSACEDCALKSGLGLPTSVSNRGTYTWNIPSEIFNTDAFKVTISSTTDPANTATSPGYKIKGGVAEVFKWEEGFYGHCSKLCGTGEQERSVKCKSQAGREDASGCTGLTTPSSKRACNTQSCSRTLSLCSGFTPERLRQRNLIQGSTGVCRCLPQNRADMINGKKEEFCGFKHSFLGQVGCNEDFCCNPLSSTAYPGNTRDCHDPCRTDSRFVVNQKGECSKTCGGGTRSLGYICLTPVLKGEPSAYQNKFDEKYYRSCVSTQCEINDGKLVSGSLQKKYAKDMPQTESCNTHACPTYTWIAAVPTTCSEPCGGGTGDSVVTCQSSEQKTVDNSFCANQPYELMTIGACALESLFITDARDCAAAATVLGLPSTTVKSASLSGNPYGCYFKPGQKTLWFNPAGNKEDDDLERVSLCKQSGAPPTTVACNEFACEQVPLQLELPLVALSTDGSDASTLDAVTGIHPMWKAKDAVKINWGGGIYKRGVKLSWSAQPDELVQELKSERIIPPKGCACAATTIAGKAWPAFCQSDSSDERPRCSTTSSAVQCPSRWESPKERGKYFAYCSSEQRQAYAKLKWTGISTLKANPYKYEWKVPADMAPVQYILQITSVSDLSSDAGEDVDESECKAYALANAQTYKGQTTCSAVDCAPRGCYAFASDNTIWWNDNKAGTCSSARTCIYASNVHHEPFGLCIMSGTESDASCLPCHPSCSANDGAGCTGTTAFDCKTCKTFKVVRDRTRLTFSDTDDDGMCVDDCPADTEAKGNTCIDFPAATTTTEATTTVRTTTATTITSTTVTTTTVTTTTTNPTTTTVATTVKSTTTTITTVTTVSTTTSATVTSTTATTTSTTTSATTATTTSATTVTSTTVTSTTTVTTVSTTTGTTVTSTTVSTTTLTTTTTTVSTTTVTTTTTVTQTTTTKRVCSAGQFRAAGSNSCKACPVGQYRAEAEHVLAECLMHGRCADHEVTAKEATPTRNVVCKTSVACAQDEWESKPPTPGQDERECSKLTSCITGQYVLKQASKTSDRTCASCDGTQLSFVGGLCTTTTVSTTTTLTTTSVSSTTRTSTTTTESTTTTRTTTTTTESTTTITTTTRSTTTATITTTTQTSSTTTASTTTTTSTVSSTSATTTTSTVSSTTTATSTTTRLCNGQADPAELCDGSSAFCNSTSTLIREEIQQMCPVMCNTCGNGIVAATATETESSGGMSGGAVAAVVIILLLAIVAVYFVAQNHVKMPWSNSTETAQESSSNSPTVVAFTNPVYLATDEVEIEKQGAITADPADEDLPLNDVGGANPPAAVIGVGQGTEEAFAGFEDVTEAPESQEGDDAKRTFTPTAVLSPTAAPTAAATPTLPAAEEDTFNGFDLDNLGSPGSFAETDAATVGIGGWATAKSLSMPAHGSSSNTTAASSNAAYLDAAPPVALGDRVTVDGYKSEGTVRFVGPHKSKGSMRVGVELDKQVGKNNGTLGGHVYFAAKERHGVLCFPNDCTIISTAGVDTGAATVVDNSKGKVIVSDMPWMEL